MKNLDIRKAIRLSGYRYWQVAEALGVRADKFSVLLRHELDETEQQNVYQALEKLKEGEQR